MFFSIVVTTYNRSKLLCRCLDSIKNQTFGDYEVLILDDCSSDDTSEVVKKYTSDERFKYIRFEENHGHGDKVVKEAQDKGLFKGEWFVFICDDEYLSSNFLQECFELSTTNEIGFVANIEINSYGCILENIYSAEVLMKLPRYIDYSRLDDFQQQFISKNLYIRAYKKEILYRYDVFDRKKYSTHDYMYEVPVALLMNQCNFGFSYKCFVVYGITPSARRKKVNILNYIVMSATQVYNNKNASSQEKKNMLIEQLTEPGSPFALIECGIGYLIEILMYYIGDDYFMEYTYRFASIYRDKFQAQLNQAYFDFNASLITPQDAESVISNFKRFVIYGIGKHSYYIEQFLREQNKDIVFFADDSKSGYCNYKDIVQRADEIDVVFIATSSLIYTREMLKKLDQVKNKVKIVTFLQKDEEYVLGENS